MDNHNRIDILTDCPRCLQATSSARAGRQSLDLGDERADVVHARLGIDQGEPEPTLSTELRRRDEERAATDEPLAYRELKARLDPATRKHRMLNWGMTASSRLGPCLHVFGRASGPVSTLPIDETIPPPLPRPPVASARRTFSPRPALVHSTLRWIEIDARLILVVEEVGSPPRERGRRTTWRRGPGPARAVQGVGPSILCAGPTLRESGQLHAVEERTRCRRETRAEAPCAPSMCSHAPARR